MIDRYRLDPGHCAFLNFEDPRLGQQLDHSLLDAWVAAFRLRRRGLKPAYWRGRGEVDFVVTTDRGITPIQVSREPSADRRQRALEEFYETFPQAQEALLVGPAEFEAGVRP